MKNYLVVILSFFIMTSCTDNKRLVDGKSVLKDLPQHFFDINTKYNIKLNDQIITYTNKSERLPNSEFSKFYIKKHPDNYTNFFNITINLSKDKKITIEGVEFFKDEIIDYLKEFIEFASEGKPALLHLNFDEHLTLTDYLEFRDFINEVESRGIKFNKKVFIYNTNLLPNCDCSL